MIKRPEVKRDVKLFRTTECFRARDKKFRINASRLGEKTRDFDMSRHDIDACTREAVFLRRVDTVITGVAADIENSTAEDSSERNGGLDHTKLDQRLLVEWSAAFKVLC